MSGILNSTSYVGSGTGNSGSDSGTFIIAGGLQYVGYSGGVGTATSTTIDNGGFQDVGYGSGGTGYAISTTIDRGGNQYVGDYYGTGTATSTTISSGGAQYVGYASGIGAATGTTIVSGGFQEVGAIFGTGTATSTTISGGTQYVGYNSGTGTATNTTIGDLFVGAGGTQFVGVSGGTGYATSSTINYGGTQYVGESGGTGYATNTTISGTQYVGYYSGTGTATGTTINYDGRQYVGGSGGTGTASNTTIVSYGIQYVGNQYFGNRGPGTATNTTIRGGGEQLVNGGGTATDTVVFGGLAEVVDGGVANAPVIDGGTLQLASGGSIGSGGIDFAAVSGAYGGKLDLTGMGTGSAFTNNFTTVISGFTGKGDKPATSDEIVVQGAGSGNYVIWSQGSGGSGTLDVLSGGTVLESMTLDGTYATGQFILTKAGSVDEIFYNVACYLAGTLIATEHGEIAVEDLRIGDLVVTAAGGLQPLKWIGTRAYSARFAGNNPDLLPIRFKPGSLAENVPARDLLVSPKHAMFLDGVLIPAEHLVNGATVVQEAPGDDIHYFHLELDSHDVLIAEGALSESFVDDDSRAMFQNAHEFRKLYPEERSREAVYCAPRVEDGYALDRVRRRLAERAGNAYPAATDFGLLLGAVERCDVEGVSGWALNTAFPNAPVCLDVIVDGAFAGYAYAETERPNGDRGFALRFATPLDPSREHKIELRRSADGAGLHSALRLEAQKPAA
jgi:autotransporter passenger strand-loop-strand repeat protein